MRQVLSDKIKEALSEPKNFQQIEDIVGEQKEFLLGITLMDMAVKGVIHYAESDKYQTEHTMYSLTPFPPRYRHPIRQESVTPRKR
jgi:hypothetical protein